MKHYLAAWKKYAVFKGRSQRVEYWIFSFVNFVILMVLAGIGQLGGIEWATNIAVLFVLVFVLPSIAVTIRRLHDIGRTGWWWLIQLVPYVGTVVMIVFACFDSQPGDNKYGPNPKGVAAPAAPQPPLSPPAPAA